MEAIYLDEIKFNGSEVQFVYHATGFCSKYFNKEQLTIQSEHYHLVKVDERHKALATCSWLGCNVLLISWLCDADIYVEYLDRSFHESLCNLKQGFKQMYPEFEFGGNLHVKKIIDVDFDKHLPTCSILYYSGGVDSTYSLMKHLSEKPLLVTLWGADLPLSEGAAWKEMRQMAQKSGEILGIQSTSIKSNFRTVCNERMLGDLTIKDAGRRISWWPGFSHGIACVSLIAPYLESINANTLYFASTYSKREKGKIQWGSDPVLEGCLRVGKCRVIHDGYTVTRQEKLEAIVSEKKRSGLKISLKPCSAQTGKNCCMCENCYLTIAGLILYGEYPTDWGFGVDDDFFKNMRNHMEFRFSFAPQTLMFWKDLQHVAMRSSVNNEELLRLLINFDFDKHTGDENSQLFLDTLKASDNYNVS